MSRPAASNNSQSQKTRVRHGFRGSARGGRGVLGLEDFLARGSRCGEGRRLKRPSAASRVWSSAEAAAPIGPVAATGMPAPKSPPGIVGARSCAGAVAAHSRSDRLRGAGGGGIGVGAAGASLPPQLLQKFAPSRFSVLQTGQIKAIATDF
ncbi:hypothetical protein J2X90_003793 [Variovorax paradoxus]|uniref:hypothetical protein n=1 Tax=Variovorax paradoxus TaxID=34073 RepID=UPI0027838EDA|nr:hypothetical protein [Variovorax paradoxus]MDQ0025970.1 hypothetical protein [Variovorax paradoxus]